MDTGRAARAVQGPAAGLHGAGRDRRRVRAAGHRERQGRPRGCWPATRRRARPCWPAAARRRRARSPCATRGARCSTGRSPTWTRTSSSWAATRCSPPARWPRCASAPGCGCPCRTCWRTRRPRRWPASWTGRTRRSRRRPPRRRRAPGSCRGRASRQGRPTLLCVPPAGSGCGRFREWQTELGDSVAVVGVQLPGREERLGEAHPSTLDEIVAAVAREAVEFADPDQPLVVFGESFGGLIGYELTRRLGEQGRWPAAMVLAACEPPHAAREPRRARGVRPGGPGGHRAGRGHQGARARAGAQGRHADRRLRAAGRPERGHRGARVGRRRRRPGRAGQARRRGAGSSAATSRAGSSAAGTCSRCTTRSRSPACSARSSTPQGVPC